MEGSRRWVGFYYVLLGGGSELVCMFYWEVEESRFLLGSGGE